MPRRLPTLIGLAALLLATAAAHDDPALHTSDNVDFVTNLTFDTPHEDAGAAATDLDFMTVTVEERDPRGNARGGGKGGPKVEVERDFAFVGMYKNGMQVVDITEPEAPEVVATYECVVAQADVFLFERPDLGRTFVAYSSDVISAQTDHTSRCHTETGAEPGEYGTFIIDVTDPYDPQSVSFVAFPRGSHQVTIDPSGTWIYSSPSAVVPSDGPGQFHIADITDPSQPGEAQAIDLVTGLDAHDIIFNEDGTRAYAASLTHTLVLDTSDPGDPEVIGRIFDPTINIHHEAHPYTTVDPTTGIEHTFLLIVDEFAGAAGNEVCPGGGVHVYDITGHLERAPVKVGLYYVPETGLVDGAGNATAGTDRCTAHVLQIHPDEGIATIAWYAMGTRVLDLNGLVGLSAGLTETSGSQGLGIREIGYAHFYDSDTWATKTNRIEDGSFYVYAADTHRHLDVFRVDLEEAGTTGTSGVWLTPLEAEVELADQLGFGRTTCLLP